MKIGNKLFPYPILNHNIITNNFIGYDFKFIYDYAETDSEYILKGITFSTECPEINRLYDEGKLNIFCVIECSYTVVRKAYKVTKEPIDIKLSKDSFTEKVSISMYAVAANDFIYKTENAGSDYTDIEFSIEKNCIIAANDGFTVNFVHDEKEKNFASSIFSIIYNATLDDDAPYIVDYSVGSKKICITLSKKQYNNYKIILNIHEYTEIFFNIFLIPALIGALTHCQYDIKNGNYADIDDVSNDYFWFRTIVSAYHKINGVQLDLETFLDCDVIELSQRLLGNPLNISLEKMKNLFNSKEDDNNE